MHSIVIDPDDRQRLYLGTDLGVMVSIGRGQTWCGATKSPRVGAAESSDSRAIPAAVRRAVWARDQGRCAFLGTHGRCTATAFLEYHHRQPYAAGGKATVENIELRCRAHNAYEAQLFFTGDVARESDVDSFWNEFPPLGGHGVTRLLYASVRHTGARCAAYRTGGTELVLETSSGARTARLLKESKMPAASW